MKSNHKDYIIFFLVGIIIGVSLSIMGGVAFYRVKKSGGKISLSSFSFNPFKRSGHDFKDGFSVSFEKESDRQIFKADKSVASEMSSLHATAGSNSLMIKLPARGEYPGVVWESYGRDVLDWSSHRYFKFDIYNNNEAYVELEVKFKSGDNYPKKSTSYRIELNPLELNNISIPLDAIVGKCDLNQMSYVKIFSKSPSVNYVLYLDNIRVE
ncbi:hypothetical protein ACFL49_03410 [Candidatus Omnitrophota bacterium]